MRVINSNFPAGSPHRPGLKVLRKKMIIIHTMEQEADINEAVRYFNLREERGVFHYCVGMDGSVHELVPEGEVAWHLGGVLKYPELIGVFGFGEEYRKEIFDRAMFIEYERYKTRYDKEIKYLIKPEWGINFHSVGVGVCTKDKTPHNSTFTDEALNALDRLLGRLKVRGWEYMAKRNQIHDWKSFTLYRYKSRNYDEAFIMPKLPDNLKKLAVKNNLKVIGGNNR